MNQVHEDLVVLGEQRQHPSHRLGAPSRSGATSRDAVPVESLPPGAAPVPQSMGGAPSGATPEPREIPAHLSQIGKYRVVGLLGRGGMGAVYQATDANLERDVALKVMLPHFADVPENRLRFEREARAAARMMHPNVVTVFDLGYHTDGSPYIVMELLKGRDLFHLLREQPDLGLRRKVALVVQVLDGLAQAHRAGIVHRDIKPGNVFIVESGDAKIMDFGIARISDTAATGRIVGTAKYMSPEQVMGLPIDGRSDLFGVGCMLAELASGRSPFESDSAMNTLHCIAHQEPVLALPAGPDKDLLEPVLVRALAKRPADRIASAVEFASALRELLADPDFGMGMRSWPGVMSSQDAAPTRERAATRAAPRRAARSSRRVGGGPRPRAAVSATA